VVCRPAPLAAGANKFDKNQKNVANCTEIARYEPDRAFL
jgi:hypothetical protein